MNPSPIPNTEIAALRQEVAELRNDVKDLLDAWTTAGGMLKIIKWVSVVGAGFATMGAALVAIFHVAKVMK